VEQKLSASPLNCDQIEWIVSSFVQYHQRWHPRQMALVPLLDRGGLGTITVGGLNGPSATYPGAGGAGGSNGSAGGSDGQRKQALALVTAAEIG
jgi:hypothetical protein